MIEQLIDIPNTLVAFHASNDVTKDDFDHVVLPAVAELGLRTDKLNYLLVLDAPLQNIHIGEWMEEILIKLNSSSTWNRVAIISDAEGIEKYNERYGKTMPGKFKGFFHDEYKAAVQWAGEQNTACSRQVFQQEGDSKD
jgi:hypothetical protein